VVIKHTAKRTRQTVHVDRLLLCKTPPPAVPEADSGVPPDSETETDGLDTPDTGTQSLPGLDQDSQSWGDTESQYAGAYSSTADRIRWVHTRMMLGLWPLFVNIVPFSLPYDHYVIV